MKEIFRRFSHKTSDVFGSPGAFIIALLLLLLWAVSGTFFHFSDTWQAVINTTITIITFLMVFLIQSVQNRDAKELQLKLDELIRSIQGARNTMVSLEELSDEELEQFQKQFRRMSKQYAARSNATPESVDESNGNDDKQ